MASVNKVILVGNLGKDPELRYMPDGSPVANFSLATSSSWKDKASGEKREETEWHRCVVYGKLAEIVSEYGKKGREVYASGRLKTRKWQDQSGADKYATEIVVDEFQLLGSNGQANQQPQGNASQGQRAQSGARSSNNPAQQQAQNNRASAPQQPAGRPVHSYAGLDDDDKPF